MKVYWLLVLALVACTRRNPAVCCLDKADCDEASLSEIRTCAPGLACVDHECVVPSCSTTGCEAATPVCNITTDVCEGCTDSSECSRFADSNVCDVGNGACVECVAASDCGAAEPVCEANACRGCRLDSECPSGACGDDGACVAESAIVYMDPAGMNAGDCARTAPCRSLEYAAMRTSTSRPHIVMNKGGYIEASAVIQAQTTSAPRLFIHGGGATLSQPVGTDGAVLVLALSATIRDLEIFTDGAINLGEASATVLAERLKIHGDVGAVMTAGATTIRDTTIDGAYYGIQPTGGTVNLERVVISGGGYGIYTLSASPTVNVSNTIIYGTSERAIELPLASGTITSSTIADVGTDAGEGARAVSCSSQMTVRSSIIWAPGTISRTPITGCNMVSTIAGPTSTAGAMNLNPQFVDSANRDYHISSGSPARDAVDTGPDRDFEGDPRPRGARFDIGADEAP